MYPNLLFAHDGPCSNCHRDQVPTSERAELVQELPTLCISCHADRAGEGEHVIGVMPSGLTGGLPLVNDRVGCITCHDPHATDANQLRLSVNALCGTCHHF